MNNGIKYLALMGSIALVTGCSSSSSDDGVTPPPVSAFTALQDDALAMADGFVDFDTGELLAAARTSLPVTGSASYDGFIGGEVNGESLIGELSLDVAFAPSDSGTISGSATGFQHESDGAYAGTLTLNAGNILPNAGVGDTDVVAGDLQGTLSNGGGVFATEIGLDGAFLGGTGTAVPDTVGGVAIGNVGAGAFEGGFVATSQ